MKKILVSVTGWVCFLVLAIIIYVAWPWMFLITGINSQPNPPQPSITYGEFPFRLEYELNGKRMVIEDTLICEYDGIGSDEGRGKYRKWSQRLASGNESVTLLKVDNSTEIYYPPGSSDYYMGDLAEYETFNHIFPNAALIETEGEVTHSGIISADDLLKKYNIKLISWDYTQPIVNSFS